MSDEIKPAQRKSMIQAFLATVIVLGFLALAGWQAYQGAIDGDMKQTLISITIFAVGFYLGSSKSSQDKDVPRG